MTLFHVAAPYLLAVLRLPCYVTYVLGTWKSQGGHCFDGTVVQGVPQIGEGSFRNIRRNCVYEGKFLGQPPVY